MELCPPTHLSPCMYIEGFPAGSDGQESACNARDPASILGLGRSPGKREWLSIPVSLPGKLHRQRSLAGHSPWGCKELDMTEQLTHEVGQSQLISLHIFQRNLVKMRLGVLSLYLFEWIFKNGFPSRLLKSLSL